MQTLLTLSVVAFVLFTVKKGVGKDRIELVNANQGVKIKEPLTPLIALPATKRQRIW